MDDIKTTQMAIEAELEDIRELKDISSQQNQVSNADANKMDAKLRAKIERINAYKKIEQHLHEQMYKPFEVKA